MSYFLLDFLANRFEEIPTRGVENFIFHRNCSDQTNSDQFHILKKRNNLHASHSQVASHHRESATATMLCIRKISKHRNELHRR